MSTTVTYKNETLATVSNNTKTLKTAGKYMEGDVVLTDVSAIAFVTQDQDGYIVLPPDGSGSSSSSGVEYETGMWTPSEDVESYTISFANTHTEAPFYYMICDNGEYYDTTNSYHNFTYWSPYLLSGEPLHYSSSSSYYALGAYRYRGSSTTALSTAGITSTSINNVNNYMTSTKITAPSYSSSYSWRAGRTYKWIAVWAPTT